MSDSLTESLKRHGFTEYEAKAYIALAGLGVATAREVCEVSGVPQGRIYNVLKSLAGRGYAVVQDGKPTYYHAEDPVEAFKTLKEDYCRSIDDSVEQLKKLNFKAKPPSPFISIHNEKGIVTRVKMLIRNAESDLIIITQNPGILKQFQSELKAAGKKVNLTVLVPDKSKFAGTNLRVFEMSGELLKLFAEMAENSAKMRREGWKTDIFMIIDGVEAITVGLESESRSATVISIPPVCFMIKRLIEMLDPDVCG